MNRSNRPDHIRITSHPEPGGKARFPINWGAASARERGPVIGTVSTCGGPQCHRQPWRLLCALSRACGFRRRTRSDPPARSHQYLSGREHRPVRAMERAGPHRLARPVGPSWRPKPSRRKLPKASTSGLTIAITKARLDLHEMQSAVAAGRLKADGDIVHANGSIAVTKIAIDPVWYLPGIAERFGCTENALRRTLFEQTAGMFPELVTRPDMHVFLPPIGGTTIYLFGDVAKLSDPGNQDHLPGARRVQRLRRVRLRYLHLPALSDPWHRRMRARCSGRRPRRHRLQSKGRPRAGRSDQIPGLQRAQAPGRR